MSNTTAHAHGIVRDCDLPHYGWSVRVWVYDYLIVVRTVIRVDGRVLIHCNKKVDGI